MRWLYRVSLILLSTAVFLTQALAQAQEREAFLGEVNADNINIRTDSTVNAAIITKANKGDYLQVIGEAYEWYKIRLPKNAPSFIKKELVQPLPLLPDNNLGLASERANAVALKDGLNIRLAASESAAIIGKVNRGETINIIQDAGGWYKIEPVNHSFGWINRQFVNKSVAKIEPPKITPELPENNKSGQAATIIEGLIKPYGKVFKRTTTHKLITNDNKIYLLKGDKKNLDILNHHRVRVTGKLTQVDKQKYPIIEVLTVEAL